MTDKGGPFAVDVTAPGNADRHFDAFRRGWETQTGDAYPAPRFTPGRAGDFRISAQAVQVHDSVLSEVRSESMTGTNHGTVDHADQVLMHVVRHNTWRFTRGHQHDLTVPVGGFMVQRTGPPTFEVAQHTAARIIIMPAAGLRSLVGDRLIAGPAATAEMALLTAHVDMLARISQDLAPTGAQAASDALIELVKGVLRRQIDGAEPGLALALAHAAQDLVNRRLAEPDLSPTMLAHELNVSVRTLHRAFSAAEETVAGYIRRSRLERARLDLLHPTDRPSVSELAARWQFADSSHFIRAFKRQYGRTPAAYSAGIDQIQRGSSGRSATSRGAMSQPQVRRSAS